MDVAVRELKAKLSAYLKQAAAGEIITVTDRGVPVAVLGPIPGRVDLSAAVDAGWVTPPARQGLTSARRHPASGTIQQTLDADRAE